MWPASYETETLLATIENFDDVRYSKLFMIILFSIVSCFN